MAEGWCHRQRRRYSALDFNGDAFINNNLLDTGVIDIDSVYCMLKILIGISEKIGDYQMINRGAIRCGVALLAAIKNQNIPNIQLLIKQSTIKQFHCPK